MFSQAGYISLPVAVGIFVIGMCFGIYAIVNLLRYYPHRRVFVAAFNKGIVMRNGRVVRIVESGTYLLKANEDLVQVDPRSVTVPASHINDTFVSADNVEVALRIAFTFHIEDAAQVVTTTRTWLDDLIRIIQVELQSVVRQTESKKIIDNLPSMRDQVFKVSAQKANRMGLALTSVDLTGISFPNGGKSIDNLAVGERAGFRLRNDSDE